MRWTVTVYNMTTATATLVLGVILELRFAQKLDFGFSRNLFSGYCLYVELYRYNIHSDGSVSNSLIVGRQLGGIISIQFTITDNLSPHLATKPKVCSRSLLL